VAQSERAQPRSRVRHGQRRQRSRPMETCATLGMLTLRPAQTDRGSGFGFLQPQRRTHRRNSTIRSHHHADDAQDRIDTLVAHAREAGSKVCCGGCGPGRSRVERRLGIALLRANLPDIPKAGSNKTGGTPRGQGRPVHDTASVPTRSSSFEKWSDRPIMMPKSVVRPLRGGLI